MAKCTTCKGTVDLFLAVATSEGVLCDKCIANKHETFHCSHCLYKHNLASLAIDLGKTKYCQTCAPLLDDCTSCLRTLARTNLTKVHGNTNVCSTCLKLYYSKCEACDIHVRSRSARNLGYRLVCQTCFSSKMVCPCCDTVVLRENYLIAENACRICATNRVPIKKYSAKATDFCMCWHVSNCGGLDSTVGVQKDLPYLGVELEVEVVGPTDAKGRILVSPARLELTARQILNQVQGFAIIKSDSSLKHGFEIVTSPATLAAHRLKWNNFFSLCEQQGDSRIVADNTCGMHVHISRGCLSTMQIGKMLEFVYNPANANFIKLIAQRDPKEYAEIDSRRTIKDCSQERQQEMRNWAAGNRHVRRTAVNTLPEHTIEIRIFRATTSREIFMSNLEFCQALMDFCRSGAVSIQQSKSFEAFCKFVHTHSKAYPYFHKFLANNRMVPRVSLNKTRRIAETCA